MKFCPRFTVRTLAIFVTLGCAYFGGWEATKKYGVPDAATHMTMNMRDDRYAAWVRSYVQMSPRVDFPFVVALRPNGGPTMVYFWFFGYVAKIGPAI